MKTKLCLLTAILSLSILVTSCYGVGKEPSLKDYPKYVPEDGSNVSLVGIQTFASDACHVYAVDLIGAWVAASVPEKESFSFTDIDGKQCQGTFEADILPLFTQANLWYPGALSCRTCHGPDVQVSYARMDLSSYQGILAGSGRDSVDAKGEDILGGSKLEASTLYDALNKGEMPPNRPADVDPKGPLVHAGTTK